MLIADIGLLSELGPVPITGPMKLENEVVNRLRLRGDLTEGNTGSLKGSSTNTFMLAGPDMTLEY